MLLLRINARSLKLFRREPRERIVEQVQFDPLLVQRQVEGLEVVVAHWGIRGRRGSGVGIDASWWRRGRGRVRIDGGEARGSRERGDGLEQHPEWQTSRLVELKRRSLPNLMLTMVYIRMLDILPFPLAVMTCASRILARMTTKDRILEGGPSRVVYDVIIK